MLYAQENIPIKLLPSQTAPLEVFHVEIHKKYKLIVPTTLKTEKKSKYFTALRGYYRLGRLGGTKQTHDEFLYKL